METKKRGVSFGFLKTTIRKFSGTSLLCLAVLGAFLFLCAAIMCYSGAARTGEEIGQGTGTIVGKAIGSFEGLTKGRAEGLEAGKKAGLTAEDTAAEIANDIRQVQNLEVLVASVKLNDVHEIGEDVEYAALYLLKGDVVFSVDLSQAEIKIQDKCAQILIPSPHGELIVDQSKVDKVAEYQRYFFSGSTEAGFDAYLNSMKKVCEASADTLDNYKELSEAAKESAKKQVTQLVMAAAVNLDRVNVDFKEE